MAKAKKQAGSEWGSRSGDCHPTGTTGRDPANQSTGNEEGLPIIAQVTERASQNSTGTG